MKYGERIKMARQHAGLTQPELAERLNGKLSQQGISYLENSDANGSEFTVQIADACNVNPRWLAYESQPMVQTVFYTGSPQMNEVLTAMQKLPDELLEDQVRHIKLLAKMSEK